MIVKLRDILDQTKLDERQVVLIYKLLLREPLPGPDEDVVDHGHLMLIETFDVMAQAMGLQDAAIVAVLADYADAVRAFGEEIGMAVVTGALEHGRGPAPMHIGMIDRQYVTVTGKDTFHDLKTGRLVDQPEAMPLVMTTINLSTLYLRHHHAWRARTEAEEAQDADDTDPEAHPG